MHILLIDDHILFRKGLQSILEALDKSLQLSELNSCREVEALQCTTPVDLILLDHIFSHVNATGIENIAKVRAKFENSPIVIVSSEDKPEIIRHAIEKGAAGFVPKSSTPEVLIAALKLILAGGTYLPPNALVGLKEDCSAPQESLYFDQSKLSENLSERQLEVLIEAIKGKANKVIARELNICEGTVKAHLSASFRALGVKNRTEAVFAAAKLGLKPYDNDD